MYIHLLQNQTKSVHIFVSKIKEKITKKILKTIFFRQMPTTLKHE